MILLSQPCMTTGKTIALIIQIFVTKEMFLLFDMLSRFVQALLARSKHLNFMAAVTVHSEFGDQENEICYPFHFFPVYFHEVMGPNAMNLVF